MPKFTPISVHDLGEYLREQRHSAQLSLRQLSAVAGISNPYLSQIERGLKKPSAEILQALAKALRISAESLYVRAGILEERTDIGGAPDLDVTTAILAEPRLNDRQRAVLLDVYESFLAEAPPKKAPKASGPTQSRPASSRPGSSAIPQPTTPQPDLIAQTIPTAAPNTKENQS
ncbi:MAG TPA: helix-turn-helix transcriptional regulator [Dermatophilaceae bacterium]|jgi:transcriptional regulator with XRE-family HTH domain